MAFDHAQFQKRLGKLVDTASSRRELARVFGVADVTLIGWERGSVPSPAVFSRIEKRTGISARWLAQGDGRDDEAIRRLKIAIDAGAGRTRSSYMHYSDTHPSSFVSEDPPGESLTALAQELLDLLPQAKPRAKRFLARTVSEITRDIERDTGGD